MNTWQEIARYVFRPDGASDTTFNISGAEPARAVRETENQQRGASEEGGLEQLDHARCPTSNLDRTGFMSGSSAALPTTGRLPQKADGIAAVPRAGVRETCTETDIQVLHVISNDRTFTAPAVALVHAECEPLRN